MGARRLNAVLKRSSGVLIALGGIFLIVKTVPLYLWPLLLGIIFIWLGWQLYIHNRYYW